VRAYPTQDGGIVGFFLDITERKLAEEKLRAADQRKDEFLAMLAHELRNPLAPISAAADLLKIGRLDEQRVRQSSAIIGRQVRHMTSLVDDLLDVSRVTRGLVTLARAPVAVRTIVDEAIEQVRPLFEARRQRLSVRLPPRATVSGRQGAPGAGAGQPAQQRGPSTRPRSAASRSRRAAAAPAWC
jgi:signal transduction histidine kinase